MAKTTSMAAYAQLVSSGKQHKQKARILAQIIKSSIGCTRQELVRDTGIPINAVCGRVNELLKDEVIHVHRYPVECEVTGNTVEVVCRNE